MPVKVGGNTRIRFVLFLMQLQIDFDVELMAYVIGVKFRNKYHFPCLSMRAKLNECCINVCTL